MTWWLWMWLGCGMSAEEQARMDALEARVVELEEALAAKGEQTATDVDRAEDLRKLREERLERLRELREKRKHAPPTEGEEPVPEEVSVRELLADGDALLELGRALIHRGPDGEYDGYRLSGIRRNTAADLLGIKNGDIVHEVGGMPLTSAEEGQAAYAAVQGLDRFDVLITRQGERVTVTIEADTLVPAD